MVAKVVVPTKEHTPLSVIIVIEVKERRSPVACGRGFGRTIPHPESSGGGGRDPDDDPGALVSSAWPNIIGDLRASIICEPNVTVILPTYILHIEVPNVPCCLQQPIARTFIGRTATAVDHEFLLIFRSCSGRVINTRDVIISLQRPRWAHREDEEQDDRDPEDRPGPERRTDLHVQHFRYPIFRTAMEGVCSGGA